MLRQIEFWGMDVVKPSKKEMSAPENAQSGEPNYIDKSAQSVGQPAYDTDLAAPAYKTMNPRYWEYR